MSNALIDRRFSRPHGAPRNPVTMRFRLALLWNLRQVGAVFQWILISHGVNWRGVASPMSLKLGQTPTLMTLWRNHPNSHQRNISDNLLSCKQTMRYHLYGFGVVTGLVNQWWHCLRETRKIFSGVRCHRNRLRKCRWDIASFTKICTAQNASFCLFFSETLLAPINDRYAHFYSAIDSKENE